jgi:hypothetical protein
MRNGLEINKYKTKRYYKDDLLHREDGPALELSNGYKSWFINGKRHRADGPAIEWTNGDKEWFLDGKEIRCQTNEEFLKIVKYK